MASAKTQRLAPSRLLSLPLPSHVPLSLLLPNMSAFLIPSPRLALEHLVCIVLLCHRPRISAPTPIRMARQMLLQRLKALQRWRPRKQVQDYLVSKVALTIS